MYRRVKKPGLIAVNQLKQELQTVLGEENITKLFAQIAPADQVVASIWSRVLLQAETLLDEFHEDYFPAEAKPNRHTPFESAKDHRESLAALELAMRPHDVLRLHVCPEDGEYLAWAPDHYLSGIIITDYVNQMHEEKDRPDLKEVCEEFIKFAQNILDWYQDAREGELWRIVVQRYGSDSLYVVLNHRVHGHHSSTCFLPIRAE